MSPCSLALVIPGLNNFAEGALALCNGHKNGKHEDCEVLQQFN